MNKVILIGRLGKDPLVKIINDRQVANFTVATTARWRDKTGKPQEKTEWNRIVAWGKQAGIAGQYLKKGSLVALEGRLETREWKDKKEQEHNVTEIVCSAFHMLDSHKTGDVNEPLKAAPVSGPEISDDDIPF